ncbi:hypothetical protein [Nakamurella leprariae]|uniref:Uncharacterized protein n=1 Tax=Nakamurella leprariae TaxID=2803911 RepID=A0A939C318_9ACTN|nr:hypothetical protein [Nakamurella leprariae]MBM9468657.1 hypothetical protein [Nakamurella leprariae]
MDHTTDFDTQPPEPFEGAAVLDPDATVDPGDTLDTGGTDAWTAGVDPIDLETWSGPADDDLVPLTVPVERPIPDLPGAAGWAPNGPLLLDVGGQLLDLGIPTLDMDGDGRPDSTLLAGTDGQLYLLCDLTGDGLTDGLVIADQQGAVLAGFDLVDGVPVPADLPAGLQLDDLLATPAADDGPAPTGPATPGRPETAEPLQVTFHTGTELVDLGPATHDFDGDGVPESVVLADADGNPAYVVSELPDGSDGLVVLDPRTGEPVSSMVSSAGELQPGVDVFGAPSDMPGNATGPDVPIGTAPDGPLPAPVPTDPARPTAGPEAIVAPTTADLSIPGVALVQHGVQGMYDVAAEVWWSLTGGEPYPRADDGTPFNPGQVFGMLGDREDTPPDHKDSLSDMQARWDRMLTTITGTGPG